MYPGSVRKSAQVRVSIQWCMTVGVPERLFLDMKPGVATEMQTLNQKKQIEGSVERLTTMGCVQRTIS